MFDYLQKLTPPSGHKIALYTRSAAGNDDQISCQEEKINTFVRNLKSQFNFGDIVNSFSDSPGSGMDMNRPGLISLLKSISSREVTLVIVTDLVRLSRSSSAFWELLPTFVVNDCNLLSLDEYFHLFDNEFICDSLKEKKPLQKTGGLYV